MVEARRSPIGKYLLPLICLFSCEPSHLRGIAEAYTSDAVEHTPASQVYPARTASYLAKVKSYLVGLPPTESEVQAVDAGGVTALQTLIRQWITLPQYQTSMMQFFSDNFQQNQSGVEDFASSSYALTAANGNPYLLMNNLSESFARTCLAIIKQKRPFSDVFTTTDFMLTPAIMVYYATLDASIRDFTPEGSANRDLFTEKNPNITVTITTKSGPISLKDTLNPASPLYMTWYHPNINGGGVLPRCPSARDPLQLNAATNPPQYADLSLTTQLANLLFGWSVFYLSPTSDTCLAGTASTFYINPNDYTDWKWVSVRRPRAGETSTVFYDLPAIRSASELVLNSPRVSFFTNPAFLYHWQTNVSNQARVTANQTLIAAFGSPIDGSTAATPGMDLRAIEPQHAVKGSPCYGCHQTLDPMRQFFLHDYTLAFSQQPNVDILPGWFDFQGVSAPGASLYDLGAILAGHPLLAQAWTQKLCTAVNNLPCDTRNPEFQRIVQAFQASNYSWDELVVQLLSSSIVTFASPTALSADEVISTVGQEEFCNKLSARLQIADICGLNPLIPWTPLASSINAPVGSFSQHRPSRGAAVPPSNREPGTIFALSAAVICQEIANNVIDSNTSTTRYSSADPQTALADFVHNLMGIPGAAGNVPLSILTKHYSDALARAGTTPTAALRSAFLLACSSPAVVGTGISN